MEDVPLIEMSIENGNIVILSIATIKFTQLVIVKRVVQNLNAFVRKYGGDIAQLGRDFIIVVPPGIDLEFSADTHEKRRDTETFDLRYEQRGVRSNIERMTGETQSGVSHSDVKQVLKDPIFGI